MDMRKFTRWFLFLALFAGFGTGSLFCGGKGDSKTESLPEGTPIGAAGLSTDIVAELTLTKKEVIYVKQLQLEVERRSKMQEIPPEVSPLDLRRMVLDAMVSERLVLQAAERAGITSPPAELEQRIQMVRASAGRPVTDQEFAEGIEKQYNMNYTAFQTYLHEDLVRQKYIEQYIVQQAEKTKAGDSISDREIDIEIQGVKDELAAQAGRVPTDAEFNDFIKRQGMDLISLRGQIRRQLMVQKYLITAAGGNPTEEEILAVYNRYKTEFTRPDTISFDYIRIPFGSNASAVLAARTRADELARKIGSSVSAFNEESAAAAAANNSGSARFILLSTEDPRIQQVFGVNFIDMAKPLTEGKVSGVIEGRQGFFIIKVTAKFPPVNLELKDTYRLGAPATVRDVINSQLMQRALTEGAALVTNTLAEDLRKEGSVTVHENLLAW
ncbi:hypothetical protein AGMMS49944_22630 [Spirochaetia bacterium]|nr:hypothetical protein AGMMS49944_22630 [Spirochaetia bacterium]